MTSLGTPKGFENKELEKPVNCKPEEELFAIRGGKLLYDSLVVFVIDGDGGVSFDDPVKLMGLSMGEDFLSRLRVGAIGGEINSIGLAALFLKTGVVLKVSSVLPRPSSSYSSSNIGVSIASGGFPLLMFCTVGFTFFLDSNSVSP